MSAPRLQASYSGEITNNSLHAYSLFSTAIGNAECAGFLIAPMFVGPVKNKPDFRQDSLIPTLEKACIKTTTRIRRILFMRCVLDFNYLYLFNAIQFIDNCFDFASAKASFVGWDIAILAPALAALFCLRNNIFPFSYQMRNGQIPSGTEVEKTLLSGTIEKPSMGLPRHIDASAFYLQPASLAAVALGTFSVVQLVHIFSEIFFPEISISQTANAITVAASATSILFPVTLLIVEKWEDGLSSVSKSQTMLSYSWALPLGTSLLTGTARFSFSLHSAAGVCLALWSVAIAGFVFFKLIRIVLFPTIRKDAEGKIVKDQVYRTVGRTAEDRAGYVITQKFFDGKDYSNVKHKPYVFGNENYIKWFTVESPSSGVVQKINARELEKISRNILSFLSDETAGETAQMIETAEDQKQSPMEFHLKIHVGQEVETADILIEVRVLKTIDKERKSSFDCAKQSKLIQNCIRLSNGDDERLVIEQFREFCNELRLIALKAAKENDISQLASLERYLGAWLEALEEAFSILQVKYNLKTSEAESSAYLFRRDAEWKPLHEAIDIVQEVGRKSLKSDNSDQPEFAKGLIELTDSLFRKMSRKEEFLSCNELLLVNLRLCWIAFDNKHPGAEWLVLSVLEEFKSFAKYYISSKLEKKFDSETSDDAALEFVRMIYSVSQEYLRLLLLNNKGSTYQKYIKFIISQPELYRYKDLDHDIEMLEIREKIGSTPAQLEKLAELKSKKTISEKLERWRQEILVGQGTLILMCLAQEARNQSGPLELETAKTFIRIFVPHLPSSVKEAFELIIRMEKAGTESKWNWKQWEHIPNIDDDAGAKWMKFRLFLENFLSLILINAASKDSSPQPVTSELLDHNLQFTLATGSHDFIQNLDKNITTAIELSLIDEPEAVEIKGKVGRYVEEYLKQSKEVWLDAIVQSPIEASSIQQLQEQFEESFTDTVRIRSLVTVRQIEQKDPTKLAKSQWGLSKLFPREHFISAEEVAFAGSLGEQYGSGFARSEDEFIFHEIIKKQKPEIKLTVEQAVRSAIDFGMAVEDSFILASRSLTIHKTIHSNPKYEPIYRTPEKILANIEVKPDGFFLFENERIPIYQIFSRDEGSGQAIIVATKKSVILEQTIDRVSSDICVLSKSGFSFKIQDPLLNKDFRDKIVAEDPDWLKQLSPNKKHEMAARYISIQFLQRVRVFLSKESKVITGIFSDEELGDL